MSRRAPTPTGSDPLLLGLLGLGAAGLLALAGVAGGLRRAAPGGATAAFAGDVEVAEPARASRTGEREPTLERARAPAGDHEARAALPRSEVQAARKERELLALFLDLERAQPGALAERAEALLAGGAPAAEKVALLRALGESGSEEHLRWLEHAVRALPDDSGPHGVSVARYALGELAAVARTQAEALPALRRLAFETRGLALGLRRSAALGLARSGGEPELGELRVALAREDDELLVAGVLAALGERPDSRQAVRLLAEFTPPARDLPATSD